MTFTAERHTPGISTVTWPRVVGRRVNLCRSFARCRNASATDLRSVFIGHWWRRCCGGRGRCLCSRFIAQLFLLSQQRNHSGDTQIITESSGKHKSARGGWRTKSREDTSEEVLTWGKFVAHNRLWLIKNMTRPLPACANASPRSRTSSRNIIGARRRSAGVPL